MKYPVRYVPRSLSNKDETKQLGMLAKSKRLYKQGRFFTRKQLPSYKHKPSSHLSKARKIYGVDTVQPNSDLAKKTGCSLSALKQIVKKGEGAYYSSGSRPNQTPQSWGLARLASSLTAGKAAAIDYDIIDKGCKHNGKAFRLATKSRRKYNFGHSKTRKREF
jgi:hypothetical protein